MLANIGGVDLEDNDISPPDRVPQPIDFATERPPSTAVVPHAIAPESARRLWNLGMRLIRQDGNA